MSNKTKNLYMVKYKKEVGIAVIEADYVATDNLSKVSDEYDNIISIKLVDEVVVL